MNAIDLKRAEFRHYLEKSGVMDTLSRALIKLYDEQPKPDDPVAFVRRHFVNVDDPPNANGPEIITTDAGDSDPLFGNKKCADALIESLREELTKAGQEIAVLQKALDTMQTSTDPIPKDPCDDVKIHLGLDKSNHTGIADENSFDQLLSDLLSGGGSLLQKHITKELYVLLADVKTDTFESTLLDCIKCYSRSNIGLDTIGLFATDGDCYDKFGEIFCPIIQAYHGVSSEVVQPDCEWGDATQLGFIDPNGSIIEWIQISCNRSIEQHLYPPRMNEFNFEEVLRKVKEAVLVGDSDEFEVLEANELVGNEIIQNQLNINFDNLEQHPFWPVGRGLLLHKDRCSAVIINAEDHLTVVSVQSDGNFALAYQRLIDEINIIGKNLVFARHSRLGYLTVCPSKLGAALSIKIAVRLNNDERLNEICEKYGLSFTTPGIISNSSSFGCTEYECIKRIYDGIAELVSEQSKTSASPNQLESKEDDLVVNEKADTESIHAADNNNTTEIPENEPVVDIEAENGATAEEVTEKIDDTSFVIERTEVNHGEAQSSENDKDIAVPEEALEAVLADDSPIVNETVDQAEEPNEADE